MARGPLHPQVGMRRQCLGVERKGVATPPRIIIPNRPVFLTLRASGRQFRFLPSKEVTDSIRYIFWHCVDVYGIKVHDMSWMSNHAHICLLDERGVLPAFTCKMNSLISKQLNALRRQRGTNIEKGYSDITVLDDWSMASFCAYALANPCAADLVSRASKWKGLHTYNLEYGEKFIVTRPNCGMWKEGGEVSAGPAQLPRTFRPRVLPKTNATQEANSRIDKPRKPSNLPEIVEGVLTRPNILPYLNNSELRDFIRSETTRREQMAIERRAKSKKGVLGMRGVLAMKWNDVPCSYESLFEEIPRIATRSQAKAMLYQQRIAEFNHQYEAERQKFIWLGKDAALFPYGTWKMRVTMKANCVKDPPPEFCGLG